MLRVEVSREVAVQAVKYHVEDGHGMRPVLEDDADLASWLIYVLADKADPEEDGQDRKAYVTINGDWVIIAGDKEIIDAVQTYIIP